MSELSNMKHLLLWVKITTMELDIKYSPSFLVALFVSTVLFFGATIAAGAESKISIIERNSVQEAELTSSCKLLVR